MAALKGSFRAVPIHRRHGEDSAHAIPDNVPPVQFSRPLPCPAGSCAGVAPGPPPTRAPAGPPPRDAA